jgi:hypothetical protein
MHVLKLKKKHLEGFRFHNNEEVEVAVGGGLRMQ